MATVVGVSETPTLWSGSRVFPTVTSGRRLLGLRVSCLVLTCLSGPAVATTYELRTVVTSVCRPTGVVRSETLLLGL